MYARRRIRDGALLSADPATYSLATLHAAELPSPCGNRLDVGHFGFGGSVDIINVSQAPFFDGKGTPLDRFTSTRMALPRMAIHFGGDGVATFDISLGRREDPDSPFARTSSRAGRSRRIAHSSFEAAMWRPRPSGSPCSPLPNEPVQAGHAASVRLAVVGLSY